MEAGPVVEIAGAGKAHLRYRLHGIGLRFSCAFDSGFSVSAGVPGRIPAECGPGSAVRQGKVRQETGLSVRSLRYRGLAPCITYSYGTNRSNGPIRGHRNRGVDGDITDGF